MNTLEEIKRVNKQQINGWWRNKMLKVATCMCAYGVDLRDFTECKKDIKICLSVCPLHFIKCSRLEESFRISIVKLVSKLQKNNTYFNFHPAHKIKKKNLPTLYKKILLVYIEEL